MARNVEIKARIASVAALLPRVREAGGGEPERIVQDDTFFACAQGRLKLRDFGNGRGELIHYQRADAGGPKLSDYVRAPTSDPTALREALTRGGGASSILGRVRKTRLVSMIGATRVHLDQVENLGAFVELEVVLRHYQSEAEGTAIAHALMARLGIEPSQLVAGAYLDLLQLPP
jgi:adenylate cyclase class IV